MSTHHFRAAQNHMATTFDFMLSIDDSRVGHAELVTREAHRLVAALEGELSEFIDDSPVARLNRTPAGQPVPVPPSVLELLDASAHFGNVSRGRFNCFAKSPRPADAGVGWDASAQTAWRFTNDTHLGFGAIGKGYALDRVRVLLEQAGFTNYYLSAGGSSLILSGFSSENQPWSWGWSWEKDSEGDSLGIAFYHTSGIPVAIGVSGLHEKGQHLIDPKSGRASTGARSALVATPSATEADALSTALFIGGWDTEMPAFVQLSAPPALATVENDGTPRWNGTFQKLWGAIMTIAFALCGWIPSAFAADEAVDLNDLGVDDFTPYMFERSRWWILLPLLALAVVAIHLKNSKPRLRSQKNTLEEIK
jgi:thiamine biosynthesis lipoprotein